MQQLSCFHLSRFIKKTVKLYTIMCTEMETLAEFLFPCCMAAGCSPETKQIGKLSHWHFFTATKRLLAVLERSNLTAVKTEQVPSPENKCFLCSVFVSYDH
jgi:hypothetical protein